MGCGKTTLGKKLARTLNYNFIDLDSYIENKTTEKITEIFDKKGEQYFRDLEKESLKVNHHLQHQRVQPL